MSIPGFGEIAEKLRRSTVRVSASRRGQGSGVIVQPDGVIVTNAHVAMVNPVEVELWDGKRAPATLALRDETRDIAILHAPLADLPAAQLADSDQLRVGELVIAVGNPLGFIGALTRGIVHSIGRVPGLGPMKWVQADVRLAPGNSGGPLANARGQVVGINTMVAAGVALAIPSSAVSRLLRRGNSRTLGITARPVPITLRGREQVGLVILEIHQEGAAKDASLMLGDIITGANGRAFDCMDDFEQALEGMGERIVRLEFLRGDRANARTVTVRLGAAKLAAA